MPAVCWLDTAAVPATLPQTMNITSLTPQQLRRAADLQEKIQSLQAELDKILGASGVVPASRPVAARGGRRLSAAGRAAISKAARARWAKQRAGKVKPAAKAKRRISAAGRARLAALARARWAKAKAQGKSKL